MLVAKLENSISEYYQTCPSSEHSPTGWSTYTLTLASAQGNYQQNHQCGYLSYRRVCEEAVGSEDRCTPKYSETC
jgi:hypothetical protein